MVEDPLHDIIESVRARLKTELETQLQTVSARHQQALDEQRNRIEAEAEQLWAPQLQAARAEVEQQAAAAAAARAALDDLQHLLTREQALAESRLEDERRAAAAVAITAPSYARALAPASLVASLRTIDDATSVSASLVAMVRAAAAAGSLAALYLANGTRLEHFDLDGHPGPNPSSHDLNASSESIAVDAFRRGEPVGSNGFAHAVPLLLDGTPVAVLYGEADREAGAAAGWVESLEVIARHGAARLGYLTALRTAQARQWLASAAFTSSSAHSTSQPDESAASARRYARLVVSEIKLYNQRMVEEGRSRRDLLTRLGPEIDRARRLFEERVPVSVPDRSEYFQQELVQTLAGGDPSLLG